jgi:hypothetical protein
MHLYEFIDPNEYQPSADDMVKFLKQLELIFHDGRFADPAPFINGLGKGPEPEKRQLLDSL